MQGQFYREVGKHLDYAVTDIAPLTGDGSDRSYYRVHADSQRTFVLMSLSPADAVKLAAGCYEWTDVAAVFDAARIAYPRVVATLPEGLIIEDCGDQTLEKALDDSDQAQLFARCFDIASKLLTIEKDSGSVWTQRCFTQAVYLQEFHFFRSMFLDRAMQLSLSEADSAALERDFVAVSSFLAQYSDFFVHKDFHSRNLMVNNDRILVIDFQDACIGSPLYDLISLCFDSYMPLSLTTRLELFATGRRRVEQQLPAAVVASNDDHWAALLLQRQLKAIGSFAKLTLVTHKGDYLRYVHPALATFPRDLIASPRWPFLSDTLLTIISENFSPPATMSA